MTPELRERLHKHIQEAAKQCEGRLPAHPKHPYGRIPIAHIYDVVQAIMGKPARECRDIRYDEILEIVKFCVDHAEDMSIIRQIKHLYEPEPKVQPSSLEDFM